MTDHSDNYTTNVTTIRLVHLQLLPLITGVQKVTLDEFRLLDGSKFEPVLFCKEEGVLSNAVLELGLTTCFVPTLVRPISPLKDFLSVVKLSSLLKRLAPDILHTHSSKTGILGRLAGKVSDVPIVIHTVHGFAFPYASSRIVRLFYFFMEYFGGKLCDALIVLNEGDRLVAIEKLAIPAEKVYLISNGVDVDCFEKVTAEQRTEIRRKVFDVTDEDVICVGMVGRLWRQKNPVCLLRAAIRVLEKTDIKVQFYFIGDGELRSELEQMISEHGLSSQIQIMGWRQDVASLLSALDIFVLPSRWEGMPLAILEAMASSLPVIVSNISGNHDLVSHGIDGLLFDSDNDIQLSERIIYLLNSPDIRSGLGENARKKVIEHYQLADRVDCMAELYQSLLDLKLGNDSLKNR